MLGKYFKKCCSVFLMMALVVTSFVFEPALADAVGVEWTGLPEPTEYHTDQWIIIPEWTTAPTIDGRLDEPEWGTAGVVSDFQTIYNMQPLSGQVEYRLAYDNNYLYVGGELALSEAENLQYIEVLLRAGPGNDGISEDYYEVKIPMNTAASPSLTTIWNPSPDVTNLNADPGKNIIETFTHEVFEQQDKLQVEVAIPLSEMNTNGVSAGDEWGFNIVHVYNLYTQPISSWVPILHADHWDDTSSNARLRISVIDEDRLGSLYFTRLPEHLVASDHTLVHWDPLQTDTTFWYDGFTDKRLTFSLPLLNKASKGGYGGMNASNVDLWWKQPGQSWQLLNDYTLTQNGTEYTLAFSHLPTLADGMYQLQIVLKPTPKIRRVGIISFDREEMITAGTAAYWAAQDPIDDQKETLTWSPPSSQVESIMPLIPPQPGFQFVGLPEMPELYPGGLYSLSSDGMSLTARQTGTVYPNEQFPEDQEMIVENSLGEEVTIPYHEDDNGKKYFITAHLWYLQKARALSQTGQLADSDPLGAARLMYALAAANKSYNPTVDRVSGSNHANLTYNKQAGPPYAYWGGIWNRWWYNDLSQLMPVIQAYGKVKNTNAFELLSDELGVDVERQIVDEFLIPSTEYVLTYTSYLSNMSFQPWKGLIEIGKALDEPDYIHRAVEQIEQIVDMFMFDGYWQEVTPSYHLQTVAGMQAVSNSLKGWTDPEGYISPRTGIRFDQLDLEQAYPVVAKAIEYGNRLVYPDGKVLPITDTWANQRPPTPLIDSGSFLMPAAKFARLAGGQGTNQTQVHLAFQPKYGHAHNDPLNLTLYAQGQELLPDIGYTHNTFYRWFALSTMSHNTVVVDSSNYQNNTESRHGGNVERFSPDSGSFQVMRASYESAYEVTEEYSREPWFVPFADGSGEQGYVLDLFRVSGGERHEYTLQGDANRDAHWETDLALTEYGPYLLPPGTNVVDPISNSDSGSAEGHYPGYIYVRDVQQAGLNDDHYELTLVTESEGTQEAKLNITGLLEPGTNELFLGRSPSLRSIRMGGNSYDNNDEAVKYTMPKLVLRREGANLQSTFATVLEPFSGEQPRLEVIERLEPTEGPSGAVAVKVVYGDTTDILLSNPNHPEVPLEVEDVTMIGEIGFIRLINGEVREMKLLGGTVLQKGNDSMAGAGVIEGTIVGTTQATEGDTYNSIIVDTEVPEEAAGQYMIVRHPDGSTTGYEIGSVMQQMGQSVIVLAEHNPGFTIDDSGNSQQTYYPGRSWTGTHTFGIAMMTSEVFQGTSPAETGIISGFVYGSEGQPLSNANVRLTGYTTIQTLTDENGSFTLSDVPVGTQYVTVDRADYEWIVSERIEVLPGEIATTAVTLLKQLPPQLVIDQYGVLRGDVIYATSNSDGYAHIVPIDTPSNREAIESVTENVYGTRVQVFGNEPFSLDSEILDEGYYKIHVISHSDLVSAGEAVVVLPHNLTYMEDTSNLVNYVGRWDSFSNPRYSGGTMMLGRESGAYVDIPFYGVSAKLIADFHTSRGLANIYLNGELVTTVDQYKNPIEYQQVIYETGQLEEGVHVIRLEAAGETTGSSAIIVSFDALDITLPADLYELTETTTGVIIAGEEVAAVSSRDGTLYVVPMDTAPTRSAIEHAGAGPNGNVAPATAGVSVRMATYGLDEGWYQFYGIDVDGRVSLSPPPFAIVEQQSASYVIDDIDSVVRYQGDWRQYECGCYMGGTMMLGFEAGAIVEVPFYGTSATLITDHHTSRGIGNIYLNDELVGTVDFYANPIIYSKEMFHTGELVEGAHMLRIEPTWTRNPDSRAFLIPFDALIVEIDR